MPDWNHVDRRHVLTAIADFDQLGQREFLRRYGFGRARAYTLWHQGNEYDAQPLLGAAYLHATGRPVTPAEFTDGEAEAAKVLSGLGFDVVVDEQEAERATSRRRTTASAARKPQKRAEPKPVSVCPTCHMALPASGVCDFCD